MTTATILPILDLVQWRLEDGDTTKMVDKFNGAQNDLEAWSTIANQFRADLLDAQGLSLSGGTLAGDLKIDTAEAALTIDATGATNAVIRLDVNGGQSGIIFSDVANNILRIQKRSSVGVAENELQIRPTYTLASKPILMAASNSTVSGSAATSLTTKDYVDTFLPLSGGTLDGNVTIDAPTGNATLTLNSLNAANSSILEFENNGIQEGFVQSTSARIVARRKHSTGGDDTDLSLYNSRGQINKEFWGISTTSNSSALTFTTKDFVDAELSLKLDKEGGDVTGNLQIVKDVSASFVVDTSVSGNSAIIFQRANVQEAFFQSVSNRLLMRRVDDVGSADTDFSLYDDYALINKPMRGVSTLASDNGLVLTTKDYVDSVVGSGGGVDLTTDQTIDGKKTFLDDVVADSIHLTDGFIRLTRVSSELAQMKVNNQSCVGFNSPADLNNKLVVYGGTSEGATLRLHEADVNGGNYLDIRANTSMTANYVMVMPASPPSAGQKLEVDNVSGIHVNMKWA